MTQENLRHLHRKFGRPSPAYVQAPGRGSKLRVLSLSFLAAEAVRYKPGYLEAVFAAALSVDSDLGNLVFDSERLEVVRRQFAHGCCGA